MSLIIAHTPIDERKVGAVGCQGRKQLLELTEGLPCGPLLPHVQAVTVEQ